jgi:hypothetical protein
MKNTQITMLLVLAIILTLLPMMITEAFAQDREWTIKLAGELRDGAPRSVAVEDLEKLPLTEFSVIDPFKEKRFSFTGVLLKELVREYGVPEVDKVQLKAVDEYVVDFTRDEWMRWNIMLATRQDGKHIEIKQSGPARIVMPYDSIKDIDHDVYNPKWIWLIKSIEFSRTK